jgi:hypothetical protein
MAAPLPYPSADNTLITADQVQFTADGARLMSGGAQQMFVAPTIGNPGPCVRLSVVLSLYGDPRLEGLGNVKP